MSSHRLSQLKYQHPNNQNTDTMCKVLIFSCISAVMLMTAAYGAPLSKEAPPSTEKESLVKALIEDLLKDLETLEKRKDDIHVDFYTPNEKQNCSRRTLECYLTEMKTLENEIKGEDAQNLQNIKKNLQCLTNLMPQGTGCKICEANDKKEFPEFHRELSNFLRSMRK